MGYITTLQVVWIFVNFHIHFGSSSCSSSSSGSSFSSSSSSCDSSSTSSCSSTSAIRLLFFDYDSTITRPVFLEDIQKWAISDKPQVCSRLTPEQLVQQFGGAVCEYVVVLGKKNE